MTIAPTIWEGCYESNWKGVITPDSFSHPAKMSRSLLTRIIRHGFDQGYWEVSSLIGDCFGGVGTTAIVGAYAGLNIVAVELEPKFVALAQANFALHTDKWLQLGLPRPTILQGDSRKFDEIVSEVSGMVCSPPFASTLAVNNTMCGESPGKGEWRGGRDSAGRMKRDYISPVSEGQIGNMKEGSLAGVISSPPYSSISAGAGGLNTKPPKHAGQQSGRRNGSSQATDQRYGEQPGQIARLKDDGLSAVITSPPFEDRVQCQDPKYFQGRTAGGGKLHSDYGSSNGQIGKDTGDDYWQAMLQVYSACFRAIKPNGVICIVVKDYVSKKQRVPLCDDSARLLEHCGFSVIERIHAMLVKETKHSDLFCSETTTKTERKSFFRRLAEKRGSPPIDFEEVIIARKP